MLVGLITGYCYAKVFNADLEILCWKPNAPVMNTRGNHFAQTIPFVSQRVITSVCLLLIGFGLVRDARAQGLQASLTNGLVAFFPFSGNANDESGNGHHGTFIGSQITLTNGVNGSPNRAYRFTGPASENRISGRFLRKIRLL